MVKIGMVINDRYEIIEKIGTGGMSDVYKALDSKLNRNVAVKVLKQEFGDNENFVSKFRVEAQAAAGLMHPNIVNVYDVGEEGGIHYIVMELVEGITLKKYIEKKARLTYKEAVSIAIQVSLGIEAAHANHIIHRDIKPQNIIISRDGKVKVTDFGIAKAASSNTITSNVMGSVHYTSPEQARGGYSDEKSDIYSLGISMFEMLTGRVPFNGETTVAIAIKHIQEAMPSPREYVPEIPQCVESIIYKCTEKSPDRRYQNMAEVITDLKQALLTPEVDFVDRQTVAAMGGTRVISESEMSQIKSSHAGAQNPDDEHLMTLAPGVGTGRHDRTAGNTAPIARQNTAPISPVPEYYPAQEESGYDNGYEGDGGYSDSYNGDYSEAGYSSLEGYSETGYDTDGYTEAGYNNGGYDNDGYSENSEYTENYTESYPEERKKKAKTSYEDNSGLDEDEDYNPRVEKITTIIAIIAGVVILIGIIVVALIFFKGCGGNNSGNANNQNEQTGTDTENKPGHVINDENDNQSQGQAPEEIKPEVQTTVVVPKLIGEDVDAIRIELIKCGVSISMKYENSDTVEENRIISANVKEGETIDKNTLVELLVSSGKGGVELPDVTGISYESAASILDKAGFTVTKVEDYSDTVKEGFVISQNPEKSDSVPVGRIVTLTVSKGKQIKTVRVPNIVGLSEEEASIELVEAGLKVGTVSKVNNESLAQGLVCSQSIDNGKYVDEGTTVDIVISLGTAVKTYKYDANIAAPSADDGEDGKLYTTGTSVKVVLATSDGKELLSTTTSSFPITGSYYGLTASTGTITLSFTVTKTVEVPDTENTNEDGTPKIKIETVTEDKTITRTVTFTEEKN